VVHGKLLLFAAFLLKPDAIKVRKSAADIDVRSKTFTRAPLPDSLQDPSYKMNGSDS
jgi:hypothetical protein